MANNRMYLCCTRCVDEGKLDDYRFFLAKYYPNTGWYTRAESSSIGMALDLWFTAHSHGGMWGEYIYTIFESMIGDDAVTSKRAILDQVQKVYSNIGGDQA